METHFELSCSSHSMLAACWRRVVNICLMVRNVLCLTPWYTSLQAGPFWYSADMKNLIYQTCISWMKGLFLHFSSHPQQGGAGRKLCWWADRHGTVHEAPKHRKGGSSGIFVMLRTLTEPISSRLVCPGVILEESVLLVTLLHLLCICVRHLFILPSVRLGFHNCHALFCCCHGYIHGKSVCTCD